MQGRGAPKKWPVAIDDNRPKKAEDTGLETLPNRRMKTPFYKQAVRNPVHFANGAKTDSNRMQRMPTTIPN